jgi:hypothetical protein
MNHFKSPFLVSVGVMAVAALIEDLRGSGSVASVYFLYGLAILYAICFGRSGQQPRES